MSGDISVYFENLRPTPRFLPMTAEELAALGYERPDFVLVSGDAYVDHPSFGAAIIGKLLWAQGYSVGVIAQPDISRTADFEVFGRPALGFMVTSGNVDSMVNNYTAAKKRRSQDFYSPGGRAGKRPDRALTAYCRKLREVFGADMPIITGGIEAGLRRLSHYDYWSDNIRKSILIESGADLLVYGMGELAVSEVAALLNAGVPAADIRYVDGTVWKASGISGLEDCISLPDYYQVRNSKRLYAESFKIQYENTGHIGGRTLAEGCGGVHVVQNRPARTLSASEMDAVYELNYAREPHPSYEEPIPAIAEVKFSITANRGCFGECNFCALTFNQGRQVASRSVESMVREAELIAALPDFKGYIHDVGGPTANFSRPACNRQERHGACTHRKCLSPRCPKLEVDHRPYLAALRAIRNVKGVKKVFVRSGIRYDYLNYDSNTEFFRELCEHHVSGQLKVAPEHVSPAVLELMGKPQKPVYDAFVKQFHKYNERLGKRQFLVPYLMSSHPGSGLAEAIELAEYLRDNNISPQQVQDFYPTPGTVSTCMYHTGINPLNMRTVYVARAPRDKAMQRALMQYKLPQNYGLVREALERAGRGDLIGFGKECLIPPRPMRRENPSGKPGGKLANKPPVKPAGKPSGGYGKDGKRTDKRDKRR